MKSNPNPSFYPTLPYESLSSCTSNNKRKEKEKENNNQKLKEKKMKRNIK